MRVVCVPGINLSGSDRKMLSQFVSRPSDQMMYTANEANDLKGLEENFIQFVCEGQYMLDGGRDQGNGIFTM